MENSAIVVKMVTSTTRSVYVRSFHYELINFRFVIVDLYTDCNCDLQGTLAEVCEKSTGQCLCKEGYGGPRCDKCLPGYYNYPDCVPCNCSIMGSVSTICDASGKCPCLASFAGKQCTQCSTGYYAYPECLRK